MRSKLITLLALNLVLIFLIIGCAEIDIDIIQPPDIPIEQLLSSPDTVLVEGRELWLSTYMWRDFMPISPPDGKPLIAHALITAIDSAPLPSSITSDAVWVVYDNQVWKSWLSDEPYPPPIGPHILAKIARDGPKWGPCLRCVDVIVRIHDSNKRTYFLLAPDQSIFRTD